MSELECQNHANFPDFRPLAAALYQACGAYDMPERVLDALLLASEGKPTAHLADGLLPCVPDSAAPEQEAVAWVNGEQLKLCLQSPYEGPEFLPGTARNIAGSAARGDYCDTPLYTHPSAEIQRLRAELEEWAPSMQRLGDENQELREKLAEAQALLSRVQRHGPANVQVGLDSDIDAFLSATAQPAECETCNGHGLIGDLPIECPDCEPAEVKS